MVQQETFLRAADNSGAKELKVNPCSRRLRTQVRQYRRRGRLLGA